MPPQIRGQAITTLIRAAERAERAGAAARAATSYATASELIISGSADRQDNDGQVRCGSAPPMPLTPLLNTPRRSSYASRARDYYLQRGQSRAVARAQAAAGRALHESGRFAEAREQLTAAAEILRADPDNDTVRALQGLATLEVFAGSPDADRLTAEALYLGQALGVDTAQFCDLFNARGVYLFFAGCWPEAMAYLREIARLAEQIGDNFRLGRALLNLSALLAITDPAAALDAGRTAAGHLRRTGARDYLATAVLNITDALIQLGDWDTAEPSSPRRWTMTGWRISSTSSASGWLAALRGDAAAADEILASLRELRASEAPQDHTTLGLTEAFTAVAHGRPEEALRRARAVLTHANALGISHGELVWAWSLAVRAAHEVGDAAATQELFALLDSYQPGHVVPLLRAERDLARARLTGQDDDQTAAGAAFAAAITGLREYGTPYHLAHGLLDHAQYLLRNGDGQAAAQAIDEARAIGARLRCQPLLDRAEATENATGYASPVGHSQHQTRT